MSKFIPEKNWTLPPVIESDEPFEVRYPHEVEFTLMDICNLKCSHCYLETENFQNRQDGFLKFELFSAIFFVKVVLPAPEGDDITNILP